MKFSKASLLLVVYFILLSSCQKDFLDKKPDRSQLVPKSISDFQAIADNNIFYNAPAMQEIASDDFEISDAGLFALQATYVNVYRWLPNAFAGATLVQDWSVPHTQILYANIILEGLDNISAEEKNRVEYRSLKGTTLFNRAFAYYNLAQLFAAPYSPATADKMPGIPLRLVSDIEASYPRGTVAQTYEHILNDLGHALPLLPDQVSVKNRPTKAAALALFARIYLCMGNYEKAESFAAQALNIRHELLDYNTIKGNAIDRIMPAALPNGNAEVILYKGAINYAFPGNSALAGVISQLYQSYNADDLRKLLFFRDRGNSVFTFRGTYGGSTNIFMFTGLATDELYLIRAECATRRGDLVMALSDLNTLLTNRFKKGTFTPVTGTNKEDVLKIVLAERRKELIARGLRWTDLRRLNQESQFAVTPKRTVAGVEYVLLPNSNRYVFPIPDIEIGEGGMPQNPF